MDLANKIRSGGTINQFLEPEIAQFTPQKTLLSLRAIK